MTYELESPSVWATSSNDEKEAIFALGEAYKDFLDQSKTERECTKTIIQTAQKAGFVSLEDVLAGEIPLETGTRIYANHKNKAAVLFVIGSEPITEGLDIVGSHIDTPRLDLKPQPLYEAGELAYFKTHYYGGVKKYQWTCLPLALHGLIYTQDGNEIILNIGEDPGDPVFYISDLLPHLAKDQNEKPLKDAIEGEQLNAIVGHLPEGKAEDEDIKNPVKQAILKLIYDKHQLKEEDFLLAELELVPSAKAHDVGLDRGLIMAYGHDDRSSAFASLDAILKVRKPSRTAVALFVDKEEVGSVGNTSMSSSFFENMISELLFLSGHKNTELQLRRTMAASQVLSADVTAAFDPSWPEVMDQKNTCYLGKGVAIKKYGGARGKSGSNDANAEFLQDMRKLFKDNDVLWQTGELGKVDQGGGGTIAYLLANRNAEVVDCGVPMLSMHAPLELVSKADIYMAMKAFAAFLQK